jgi:hypothetical protein
VKIKEGPRLSWSLVGTSSFLFFLLASTQARRVHIFANTRDAVFAVHDDVELILGVTIDVGHK